MNKKNFSLGFLTVVEQVKIQLFLFEEQQTASKNKKNKPLASSK